MTRHPTRHSFNKCTWTKTLDTLRSIRCGQYKTRTADCGLGIKYGLGIKRGLENMDWV